MEPPGFQVRGRHLGTPPSLHFLAFDDLVTPEGGGAVGAIGKGILRQLLGSELTPQTPVASASSVDAI